jgi:hypothetical protein
MPLNYRHEPIVSFGMPDACTANEFVDYIARLYAFAREYRADADHNALVLQFLRHKEHASLQWYALVGGIDYGFVNLVDQSGIAQIARFQDPVSSVQIKVSHLAASCAGVYEYGQPEATTINRGDITGWSGDWITSTATGDARTYSSAPGTTSARPIDAR